MSATFPSRLMVVVRVRICVLSVWVTGVGYLESWTCLMPFEDTAWEGGEVSRGLD